MHTRSQPGSTCACISRVTSEETWQYCTHPIVGTFCILPSAMFTSWYLLIVSTSFVQLSPTVWVGHVSNLLFWCMGFKHTTGCGVYQSDHFHSEQSIPTYMWRECIYICNLCDSTHCCPLQSVHSPSTAHMPHSLHNRQIEAQCVLQACIARKSLL